MAKAKKGKKASADAVYAKKTGAAAKANPFAPVANNKKINPFEVHVNKEKFQILGRTCKHDKGLPGVSRGKANKKRKETLGQEYQQKYKSNKFRDRRIGRHLSDAQLTEEVMTARFMAEKMSQMKQSKASRFNLNDDEVLTHRGKTLEEIEQFHDERSDDEDAADEGLDADFTEAAHFGGEAAETKDRKTAIEEMIIEQKRRKVEIAKEKDEVHNLTEKLDSNYKQLAGLMGKMSKNELKVQKVAPDDYDKVMREMIFEPRGVVTDKLLSEEELAKQEKERLEQLENERLKRMRGDGAEEETKPQQQHRSADDLDDGYFAYGEEEEVGTLAYHLDGKLGTKLTQNGQNSENDNDEAVSEDNDDEASETGEDEEESDSENAQEQTGKKTADGEDDDDDQENDGDEDSDDAEVDNLSDLKSSDSEAESAEVTAEQTKSTKKSAEAKSQRKQSIKSELDDNLPFTMELPASYSAFQALLSKRSPEHQAIIVERLIKCNHPKLDGVNREKVVKLFAFLLQYIDELFSDATQDNICQHFRILDRLNPQLYDLMQLNPERMSSTLLSVIKEKYAAYRKQPKIFPPLETIIYFKLVSNYYSTSDFRHPVVTPCYIFIQHILSKARVHSRQDIAMGLFLVTIALEYAHLSQRFLPAVYNFLLGVLYLSVPKRPIEVLKIVPPFQSTGPMSKLLAISSSSELDDSEEQLLQAEDLVTHTYTLAFKVRALNMCLKLIKDAVAVVAENVGANYLAEPLLQMLQRLPLSAYPAYVRQNYATAEAALQQLAAKHLRKLVPPEKKPKALRLLEPRIETVYDDKRRPKVSKEKEEKLKLLHKIKRETKGAVREIRRDTEFLQKMRIQQQIQSDAERKEKVKRIFSEAAMQQGELNELARLKKKKKF